MSQNLDLFRGGILPREPERSAPFQQGSETSKEAAGRIAPKAGAIRGNVLNAIVASGERGSTRKELESVTGYLTQTLCARLNELEQLGEIRKSTRLINGEEQSIKREGCSVYTTTRKAAA